MDRVSSLLVWSAVLAVIVPGVWSFGSGVVTSSCGDLTPGHSSGVPQTDPSPYTVTADRTSYQDGDLITVELQAQDPSSPFIGFMLQAREEGGDNIPLGSFTVEDHQAQTLTCNSAPNSAVSHTSKVQKTSVRVTWRAAASVRPKPIQFRATFVQSYRTYWVGVRSPSLSYSKVSVSSTPPYGNVSVTTPSYNNDRVTTPSYNNDSALNDASTTAASSVNVNTSSSSSTNKTGPLPTDLISSAGCGVSKVCFSQPVNCDPAVSSSSCYFMSALVGSTSQPAVQFEMTGPSMGYVAFGFSDDKMMGNDDIYICVVDSSGMVQVQHAFSTGRQRPRTLPLGNVSDVKGWVKDGVISCSFTSMNPISTQRTTGFNKPYYVMMVHGPSHDGQIHIHSSTFISDTKVDISQPQLVEKAVWTYPPILKAHGALMLIAWMTTGTLGMLVARYMKGVAKGQGCLDKDVWFLVHVGLMILTVVATCIAFILVFSHRRGWSGGAHSVLGCLVMILSLIQPAVAVFRCAPQHHLRFLFNWSHSLNAVAIKGLAVAAIFTGLKWMDGTEDKWLMKVMGGFVAWEALFYILFDLHNRWLHKDSEESDSAKDSFYLMLLGVFSLGNITFLVALLVGIGMS